MEEDKARSDQRPPSDEDTPEYREWLAAAYDTDVHEHWLAPFEELALKVFAPPEKGMALEIGCATGRATERLFAALPKRTRLVAQEDRVFLLERARARLGDQMGSRLFFNSDNLPKLRYDDKVFSCAFSNLSWWERADRGDLLVELVRVLDDDATLLLTAPLAGTFRQLFDLLREVLVKLDLAGKLGPSLVAAECAYAAPEAWADDVREAGLGDVRVERHSIDRIFGSSHGLFASTVAQARWLGMWKQHLGDETDRLLWHVRQMIDAYWSDTPFPLTIEVGCLVARKIPGARMSLAIEPIEDEAHPEAPERHPMPMDDSGLGPMPGGVSEPFSPAAGDAFASGEAIADVLLSTPEGRLSQPPEPIRIESDAPAAIDVEPVDGEPVEGEALDSEPPSAGWSPPSVELGHGTMVLGDGEIQPEDLDEPAEEEPAEAEPLEPVDAEPLEPVDLEEPRGQVVTPIDLGAPPPPPVIPVDPVLPDDEPIPDWDQDFPDDDFKPKG